MKRRILLAGGVAALGLAGALWWFFRAPGAVDAYQKAEAARARAPQHEPAAAAFRATVCGAPSCVLVEAGGLAFLVGAGRGVDDGLAPLGLVPARLDGVLLPGLTVEETQGLPALGAWLGAAGRRQPLNVYGPAGVLAVVDGANLMLAQTQAVRLAAGREGADEGLAGVSVFDSGVVAIRAFGDASRGGARVYRIEFAGKALILAGCQATQTDLAAAASGMRAPAAVIAAGANLLSPGQSCLDVDTAAAAARQLRLSATLLIPTNPDPLRPLALAAWRETMRSRATLTFGLGAAGVSLDLSGDQPQLHMINN